MERSFKRVEKNAVPNPATKEQNKKQLEKNVNSIPIIYSIQILCTVNGILSNANE